MSVDIENLIRQIVPMIRMEIEDRQNHKNCVCCEHFMSDGNCGKTNPLIKPPAHIIAYGCNAFENKYKDLPF